MTDLDPSPPHRRVGVLGLGAMGAGMASCLLHAGLPVAVFNRTPERAEPLAARGATVAATPAELAATVDVVLLSLADEAAVTEMLSGPDGVLAGAGQDTVVVDTSTVSPSFARDRADQLAAAGHRGLEACLVGNADHARAGELRFLVGGSPDVLAEVTGMLEVLGRQVTLVGDTGAGAALKLLLNMLMGVQMQSLAEAVVLGERLGLARETVLPAISASGFCSPVMRFKAGVMQRGAYDHADFRLRLMRKDLALVRAEAQRVAVALPAAEGAYGMLTTALHQGLGDLDCAAVLLHVEQLAGAPPDPATRPEPVELRTVTV